MYLSQKEIVSTVEQQLHTFHPQGPPESIEGGNLNYVWRLEGEQQNLIVKAAPPYIASNPEMPLNPKRIDFEAKALQLFEKGNMLHPLASDNIRPPHFLFYDQQKHLLGMEDVGDLHHIGQATNNSLSYSDLGKNLGQFIADLHKKTFRNAKLAEHFNNIDIQQTRMEVQYKRAADYAARGGIQNTVSIQKITEALGRKLQQPGCCLIMGDLWPHSVLLDENRIRLIDWEFCHYGRPLQDIGHFAAHCWMQAHFTPEKTEERLFKILWESFFQEYQNVLGSISGELITDREVNDISTHIGAEILVRATGPFKGNYVYHSLNSKHPLVLEATQKAYNLIMAKDFSSLWD